MAQNDSKSAKWVGDPYRLVVARKTPNSQAAAQRLILLKKIRFHKHCFLFETSKQHQQGIMRKVLKDNML
jgi:hypothetical protein